MMLVKLLREGLGRIIVLANWLSRPKPIARSSSAQEKVNELAKPLALYQFYACPFCVKVRRQLHRLNAPVELRDAQNDESYRQELTTQGGKTKVPCLRIVEGEQVTWLYESGDIIAFLEQRFENVS